MKQAAHHIAHEQQGNQDSDQREGQRHDGEANLLRTFNGSLHR